MGEAFLRNASAKKNLESPAIRRAFLLANLQTPVENRGILEEAEYFVCILNLYLWNSRVKLSMRF